MPDELKGRLKKHGLVTLTILFDDAQECKDLAEFGEVVQLEDICDRPNREHLWRQEKCQ